jgi:hypothetical protein
MEMKEGQVWKFGDDYYRVLNIHFNNYNEERVDIKWLCDGEMDNDYPIGILIEEDTLITYYDTPLFQLLESI